MSAKEARAALIDYLSSRVHNYEVPGDMVLEILDNDELIYEAALRVLQYREKGDRKIVLFSGHTLVLPGGVEVPSTIPNVSLPMVLEGIAERCDIVIDHRGRVTKNRHGAHSAPPVENPKPAVGKMDPLQANATLLDRLMLQHASAYRFGGIVDGVGFFVTVTTEMGSEGWALIRHYEGVYWESPKDPILAPCILAEDPLDGGWMWVPLDVDNPDDWSMVNIEEEREAIQLALDLTDGRTKAVEFGEEEETTP